MSDECKFASPFDTNGVFHHIGTKGDTGTYKNPHDSGDVVAKMSNINVGCLLAHPSSHTKPTTLFATTDPTRVRIG
jgi:hypothetical protein